MRLKIDSRVCSPNNLSHEEQRLSLGHRPILNSIHSKEVKI